jgi:hypothetical protein
MDPAAAEEMRAAIQTMLSDPAITADMAEKGMPIVFMAGAEQQELVNQVFEAAADLTPIFKDALKQIQ